jgi:hypothetical protein
MIRDGDHPGTGPTARTLGVRIPADLPAPDGMVSPGTGGMSVSSNWRALPPWRIPSRLSHLAPDASGRDDLFCWKTGDGTFDSGPLADGLLLRLDSPTHGLVEPAEVMQVEAFQGLLAATRDLWVIDEA